VFIAAALFLGIALIALIAIKAQPLRGPAQQAANDTATSVTAG